MPGFLVRWLIVAAGLWVAGAVLPGVAFHGTGTLLVAALLLGIVNAVVRPLVVLFTLPLTVLTLGLFLWVINAAMLGLVAAMLDGFQLAGFGSALLGSALVSLTSWVAARYVGPRGNFEVMVVEERHRPAD